MISTHRNTQHTQEKKTHEVKVNKKKQAACSKKQKQSKLAKRRSREEDKKQYLPSSSSQPPPPLPALSHAPPLNYFRTRTRTIPPKLVREKV